ncbi:unnamed protein product, partial [marine sediment metagenome]
LEFAHTLLQADTVEAGYQDAATISIINSAIDKAIKTHCGRCFNKEEGAIEHSDGDGSHELWLEDYPVSSVVLYMKTDDDVEFDDVEDLIAPDDYVVYPDTGRIYYMARFIIGHRNIKAVYTKGYSDADMPEDLKTLVCKVEMKNFYGRWKEDSGGLKNYSLAGIKKTFEEGLSPLSLMILDGSYVKKRI